MLRLLRRLALIRHKWAWITDVSNDHGHFCGLYQCRHCGEISVGHIRAVH